MRNGRLIGLGMFLSLLLHGLPGAAVADGGHGGGGGGQRQNAPAAPSSPTPSAGLLQSWHRLLDACDAVSDDVEHGQLKSLRVNAGSVSSLAQALMEHTSELSGSKKSRVKSGITQLTKVSEHLQTTAASGNNALIRSDVKRIARALRLISSQYAAGSLPLSAHTVSSSSRGHHD